MGRRESQGPRVSRAEYRTMIELGVFPAGQRVELLGGELVVAEPRGPAHHTAIRRAARALEAAFGPGWEVRAEGPVALDEDSEPEPDVAVIPEVADNAGHLSRPVLLVEVAEGGQRPGRDRRASLYARAGVAEYWVVDVTRARVEVHREPVPDRAAPYGCRYRLRQVLDASARVTPLAAPAASIPVRSLLPGR